MKSQKLIIDLVRNWIPRRATESFLHRNLDLCDVIVVNSDPEYPGLEKVEGTVIWDRIYLKDDERQIERDALVHELFRKFAVATGTTISCIKHVGLMTYVDFKNVELENVEDMEWMSSLLPTT